MIGRLRAEECSHAIKNSFMSLLVTFTHLFGFLTFLFKSIEIFNILLAEHIKVIYYQLFFKNHNLLLHIKLSNKTFS